MIAKLTGIIDGTFKDSLIIDVGGVGYYVFCSARTLAAVDAKDGHAGVQGARAGRGERVGSG